MGSSATTHTQQSKRLPSDSAVSESRQTETRVPDEYRQSGGWEALPRNVRHLFGNKMPSGFAWMVLLHLNKLQLQNWRNGRTYDLIPAAQWSDGKAHRIATVPITAQEIADSIDCSKRTVEVAVKDMCKRGVLATRLDGRVNQYALKFDSWSEVPAAPVPVTEDDDDDDDDDLPPAAKEGETFRFSGAGAIRLPKVHSVGLGESIAQRFELSSIVVAGELRITEIRPISETATTTLYCGGSPSNSLIPLGTQFSSEAPSIDAEAVSPALESAPSSVPLQRASSVAPVLPKHWRDTVNDLGLSLCKVTAGPALVKRVSDTCTNHGISPVEFIAYCDSLAGTSAGRKSLGKYGAALLGRWAEDLGMATELAKLKAWEGRAEEARAADRERRRRWAGADAEFRAALVEIDPDNYPPRDEESGS